MSSSRVLPKKGERILKNPFESSFFLAVKLTKGYIVKFVYPTNKKQGRVYQS